MDCKFPSFFIRFNQKNGHIHNGKQKYKCLACKRQFVLDPTQKIDDERTKDLIRKKHWNGFLSRACVEYLVY